MTEKQRNRVLGITIVGLLLIMALGSYYVQNVHSRQVEQVQSDRKQKAQQTRHTLNKAGIKTDGVSDAQLAQISSRAKAENQSVVTYVHKNPKMLKH
ncbi:hypothetical protein JOC36_000662 [Weissella uvarum]|uniref:hypothetical protein n=1 Tax=Weissella uvarum TaxID=1479233 RepID=UPI00196186C2|nr:hypothetical protein [Weissella uvarum]MBM7617113.1 hypothetical protein [Weissella uvarum]MCM0595409.1 hypothetical protein [Weissella uvarum]